MNTSKNSKTFFLRSIPLLAFSLIVSQATNPAFAIGSHKVFNVKTYGAQGNGTSDDTASIKAAITAAGSNSNNVVFFPAGTYLYSSGLIGSGVTLQGQSATLLATGSASLILQGTNPSIQDMNFQTQGPGLKVGVFFSKATNPTVSGSTFASTLVSCISTSNCTGGSVTGNNITVGSNSFGVFPLNNPDFTISGNTISVANNAVKATGIVTAGTTTTLTINSNNFVGNSSYTSNNSIAFESKGIGSVAMTSNNLDNWTFGFVSQRDTTATFTSNILNNTSAGAIFLAATGTGVATRNQVTGVSSGPGIVVTQNAGLVTVSNNQISSTGTNAILSNAFSGFGFGGNIAITGNALSNAGLKSVTTAAVYANNPKGTAVTITGNQYKGSVANLTYFIDAVQAPPVASVSGNKTNTLLPTKVGP